MVIDIHAHHPAEQPDFPARLVDELPKAGIDRIVLFSAGEDLGFAPNETILAAAQKYPEHIAAFAFIELGKHTADDVTELSKQGYVGFKITNPAASYDSEEFFPLYERMEQSGMPLLAHTGILMRFPQRPDQRVNSRWMRPICLDCVVRRFSSLNIIGAHLGTPWYEEASMMARIHPNYFVDLTGAYWGGWRVTKTPEFYHQHFFWPEAWDKVLFGTDILALDELIPAKKYHDDMIDSLDLPAETRQRIYGDTAARLLGWS